MLLASPADIPRRASLGEGPRDARLRMSAGRLECFGLVKIKNGVVNRTTSHSPARSLKRHSWRHKRISKASETDETLTQLTSTHVYMCHAISFMSYDVSDLEKFPISQLLAWVRFFD